MDQISPPMRIVLAVAIVFLAAYMLVLRPKDEEVAPTPTPATAPATEAGGPEAGTALGNAVEQANEAAAASEARSDEITGESSAPSTTQTAPETAQPSAPTDEAPADPALAKLPDWLENSIDKKVVALLFTNAESADDKRTSRALQDAYDADGEVVTRVVNVKKISAYQAVAEGVDVSQSPTLMVIDRDRGAQAYSGYSSLATINQAIIDGLLATDNPVKKVEFLQTAQSECRAITNQSIIGETEGTTPAGALKNLNATLATMGASIATLSNAPAPAAYKPVKAQLLKYLGTVKAAGVELRPIYSGKSIDTIKVREITSGYAKLESQTLLALNAVGVSTCN